MKYLAIDTETRLIEYPEQVNPDGVCLAATWGNGKINCSTLNMT